MNTIRCTAFAATKLKSCGISPREDARSNRGRSDEAKLHHSGHGGLRRQLRWPLCGHHRTKQERQKETSCCQTVSLLTLLFCPTARSAKLTRSREKDPLWLCVPVLRQRSSFKF